MKMNNTTKTTIATAAVTASLALSASAATIAGNTSPVNTGPYDLDNMAAGTGIEGHAVVWEDGGEQSKGIGQWFESHATDTTQLNSFSILAWDRGGHTAGDPPQTLDFVITVGELAKGNGKGKWQ